MPTNAAQSLIASALLTGFLLLATSAAAQVPYAPWGHGIEAGREAYELAESQRLDAVGAQIEQNDVQRYSLPWTAPYGRTLYYGRLDPFAHRYGPYPYYGYAADPWTGVGYSILGPYYAPPSIRQPIGQRQEQTGPYRWESYPIYDDEGEPAPPLAVPTPRFSGPREF